MKLWSHDHKDTIDMDMAIKFQLGYAYHFVNYLWGRDHMLSIILYTTTKRRQFQFTIQDMSAHNFDNKNSIIYKN
jgi:hypothetical protein